MHNGGVNICVSIIFMAVVRSMYMHYVKMQERSADNMDFCQCNNFIAYIVKKILYEIAKKMCF